MTNPFDALDRRLEQIEHVLSNLAKQRPHVSEKKYYSIAEASRKLNVAAITLYRNCKSGKIPSKRIGSRLMIPGSYVDRAEE